MKNDEKIEKVFEKMFESGQSVKGNGRPWSERTSQTYASVCKAYANWLENTYGIADIMKSKPRHAYEYFELKLRDVENGNASAWTASRFPHALHALSEGSKSSGVYQRKLKLGNKRVMLTEKNERNIERVSTDSKTLKATSDEFRAVIEKIESSRSPNATVVAKIHTCQRSLGLRITESLDLKKSSVTFNTDGTMTVRIKGKGGLVRYVTTNDEKTKRIMREHTQNKKSGAPIFQIKDKNGNDMGKAAGRKTLIDNIRRAALKAGVDRDGKKYTTHSGRKVFAQERMNEYVSRDERALTREIEKRCKSDADIKRKYNRTMNNIKNKVSPGKRSERTMTHKEMCQFLTSTDLGHGRLDVIRYYCDYPNKK
ncbi:MAG: site-specific integrase [Anaerobacillus sp.]